jgi:hypothetical protein
LFSGGKEVLALQFKYKLAMAFAVFGMLVGTVFVIQWAFLSQPANTQAESYSLDEAFSAQSFLYGPQSWVPYATKLPVMPGVDINGDSGFYLMFVDLNATSNLKATFPCVRVDYSFEGLHGSAAFHVYGYIEDNKGLSWTNRVEESGGNGFYVTAPSTGSSSTLSTDQPMSDFDHIYVKVSNQKGATFNDFGNNTYFVKFEKAGGGLNSLHITTDPSVPSGNITTTNSLTGTFYVNFTGDRIQDDFILLIAVNGSIGNDFALNLKSSAPG